MRRLTAPMQIGLALFLLAGTAAAQVNDAAVNRPGEINADIIKAGLRTAEPEDQGFVERVMANVEKGIVPRDLVESTFNWARKKESRRKFQYFKFALIERAKDMGINEVDALPEDESVEEKPKMSQRFAGFFGRIFSAFSLESLRSRF